MTVQAESFHVNGHIIGFRPQIQKLESRYKTSPSTLTLKGLTVTLPRFRPRGGKLEPPLVA